MPRVPRRIYSDRSMSDLYDIAPLTSEADSEDDIEDRLDNLCLRVREIEAALSSVGILP